MKKLLVALLALGLLAFSLPGLVAAQAPEQKTECAVSSEVGSNYQDTCGTCGQVWDTNADSPTCQPICCILTTIENVGTWFFWIVLIIALIMLLWGAVQFMTAGGSEEKTAAARQTLIYALIGVVVAYFSQLLIDMAANLMV